MTRRAWLLWLVLSFWLLLWLGVARARQAPALPRYVLGGGLLTSEQHELDLGYFNVGSAPKTGLAIVVLPGSPAWSRLSELRGRAVRIEVVVLPAEHAGRPDVGAGAHRK